MTGPRICPHCDQEMDEDLAELGICSECGDEFTEAERKERDEEREGEESSCADEPYDP